MRFKGLTSFEKNIFRNKSKTFLRKELEFIDSRLKLYDDEIQKRYFGFDKEKASFIIIKRFEALRTKRFIEGLLK